MVGAISPKEVARLKTDTFPDYVFEAFNALIASNFTNGRARFTQEEVVDKMRVIAATQGVVVERAEIYADGLLNVEEVYREKGWEVDYDRPAYNEDYKATFTFAEK